MAALVPTQAFKDWSAFENAVWPGVAEPITRDEVQKAIDMDKLHAEPINPWATPIPSRDDHIQRVAYLAVNSWTEEILIDVGVPSMGAYVEWIIEDGNHRLAAAFFRGDTHIKASVGGDIDYAAELLGVKAELLLEDSSVAADS